MSVKVSIIMPSKNVINYIGECLDSVTKQTLKDIEIIVVDAFSTDGTREVIEDYVKKDSRVRLLDDDKGSCGYAYNIGIKAAKGKYIGFVETDDYVRKDMFEILYNKAEEFALDYVKANHVPFVNIDDNYRIYFEERIFGDASLNKYYGRIICPVEMPEILWPDHCMWNGIYSSEFLHNNDTSLNESKGPSYQDHGFQWKTMTQAKRAMYLDEGLYFYRKDNESASMKNPKGMIRDFHEYMFIKNYLMHKDYITDTHWAVYYQKMYFSLKSWCNGIVDVNGKLPDECLDVFEKYKSEISLAAKEIHTLTIRLGIAEMAFLKLLCKDSESYLLSLSFKAQAIKESIVSLKRRVNDSSIVIFGAGNWGQRCLVTLKREFNNKINCFCDNNRNIQGNTICGYEIYSPDTAVEKHHDSVYIIANEKYYMDCLRQLKELGVSDNNICFYTMTTKEI